jgi:AcrR family transcriptional regulator
VVCGTVSDKEHCRICADPRRDRTVICVVEEPKDVQIDIAQRPVLAEALAESACLNAALGGSCGGHLLVPRTVVSYSVRQTSSTLYDVSTSDVPIWSRPEPGQRKPRFTRDQIAQVAMEIADKEGLDAVSMRRVANELGAGTMTLYHYVKNKGELFALMEDAMMGELLVPAEELPSDWRGGFRAIAQRSRATHRRHPWIGEFHEDDRAPGGPNGMRHFEQSLAVGASTGLPLEQRLEMIVQLDEYTLGFAMRDRLMPAPGEHVDEEELAMLSPDGLDYMRHQLATGDYPNIAALIEHEGGVLGLIHRMIDVMTDQDRFERGLERLLDGFALEIERAR